MILEMKHITKIYGQVTANRDVSLMLDDGEILAVVGENGAGKSTLMKILYGLETPNGGEIFVRGQKVTLKRPSEAMKLGIGMVQQHFMLFGPLTVAENIVFHNEISHFGFFDKKKNIQKVRELSEKYMLTIDPLAKVEDCPVGTQQRVEILKIMHQNADIIIFDEPSAVLTPIEVSDLLNTMKQLAKLGKSIILITHKLDEVMGVADRVVVMRAGSVVAERSVAETSAEALSYDMIGRQIENPDYVAREPLAEVLRVENLSMGNETGRKVLDEVSLTVRGGEIVGIAGVSGNGQSELLRCITGLERNYQGKVTVCGKDVSHQRVNKVREAGLTHIPEDRYFWGSARDAALTENILMGDEDSTAFSHRGILKVKEIARHADRLIRKYSIRVASPRQKMRELSGGNAQKLITAREIERNTPLLLACEPTRGIDIGAMEFVHDRLLEMRGRGSGVLLVSSELSEILKLSDRVYVMYSGKINHEFRHGALDDRKLGMLMVGGQAHE
jgi:simple sugar transport system ATP-binding protein